MITDIEQQYCDYLRDVWRQVSETATDNLEPQQDMCNVISLWSIHFLQEKLKALEAENKLKT